MTPAIRGCGIVVHANLPAPTQAAFGANLMSSFDEVSLKQRVWNAGAWSLAGYAINLAIRFGSNLLLTRLLVPEMFGVMAIASIVLAGLAMFSDVGLKPSVIQNKRGDTAAFLNTVWVTQIVRGVVLWIFALGIALLISKLDDLRLLPNNSVYENSSVPYVIGILSFTMVIAGFESTKLLQASRDLSLGRLTAIDMAAQISGLLAMLAWVSVDRSIWALVAGSICTALTRTTLSYVWLPGVANRFQWEGEAFREIINFGKWIFLSSALFFFAGNGDRMLLGALVDAASLGTYVIAFLFFSLVDQILGRIIIDVSFPALGEVFRKQPTNLKNAYYRFHMLVAAFTYVCAGVFMVSGHTIINILYDQRYQQAGRILEILAVALLTLPFRMATQSFLLLGAARLYFYLNTTRMLSLFAAIPIGFYIWGFTGALWGVVLSYFSSLPIIILYAARFGLFDFQKELLTLSALVLGLISGEMLNYALTLMHLH